MPKLYYTAPSDEIFEEVKQKAIDIWKSYDNTYGYVDEKTGRLKDVGNVQDNLMYIVAMFDHINQGKLATYLSDDAKQAIRERMIDGGNDIDYVEGIGF